MRGARAALNGRRPASPYPEVVSGASAGPVAGGGCWSPALHPPAEVSGGEARPCALHGCPLSFPPSFPALWWQRLRVTGSHTEPWGAVGRAGGRASGGGVWVQPGGSAALLRSPGAVPEGLPSGRWALPGAGVRLRCAGSGRLRGLVAVGAAEVCLLLAPFAAAVPEELDVP